MPESTAIESVLTEARTFEPPKSFSDSVGGAYIGSMDEYRTLHKRSIEDPEGFWAEISDELDWFEKPTPGKILQWSPPDATWFAGAKTNICHNCIDRQIQDGHGDDTAIIWESEPVAGRGDAGSVLKHEGETVAGPEIKRLSYNELKREVCHFANGLKELGVKKGDVVTIYMGMVPELAVAVLACARIGAVHSVIFGGFSSQAIVDRVTDADSFIVITCDGAWRRGAVVALKDNVDEAAKATDLIKSVVVLKRCDNDIQWDDKKDTWWHELVADVSDDCPCEIMDAEDMLFLLYTSGSTGKPKGIVHTTGGYMVWTYLTSKVVFNLKPDEDQVFWCTADIGWITGHSYIIYGILPNRVPTLMYEGAPNYPAEDRFWDIVERHKVTQFYTAPTAIRAFMKWGREHADEHDLSSLKVLGTVGEPINPEAWMWYHRVIGNEKCPIVDTWWQTETGGHMITPLPGATPTTPGSCTLPFFGIDAVIADENGNEQPPNTGGLLAIRKPWPGMLRGIHGDRKRFIDTYFSKFKVDGAPALRAGRSDPSGSENRATTASPWYFPGDGARRDEQGYFWIMGRVDDVINVSGHRLGTMEVESALVSHESVVEAAVVGMPHEIKGTGIAAFCTLEPKFTPSGKDAADQLKSDLRDHVAKEIGAIAKPDTIRFTDALPKTRSGKIMRRLLRDIASGEEKPDQDTTTLEDYTVLAKLRESKEG